MQDFQAYAEVVRKVIQTHKYNHVLGRVEHIQQVSNAEVESNGSDVEPKRQSPIAERPQANTAGRQYEVPRHLNPGRSVRGRRSTAGPRRPYKKQIYKPRTAKQLDQEHVALGETTFRFSKPIDKYQRENDWSYMPQNKDMWNRGYEERWDNN